MGDRVGPHRGAAHRGQAAIIIDRHGDGTKATGQLRPVLLGTEHGGDRLVGHRRHPRSEHRLVEVPQGAVGEIHGMVVDHSSEGDIPFMGMDFA